MIQKIRNVLHSIKARLALPPEPDYMEQIILDSLSGKRPRPESDRDKYVKSLEALVAEQKKTIRIADAIVGQAQWNAMIEEVNRLRMENAALRGAYVIVQVDNEGKKRLTRFSLN